MVDLIVSGHPAHRDCHSSFYESDHKNDYLLFSLFVTIWSVAQYCRATPCGMWYLALKPSILA